MYKALVVLGLMAGFSLSPIVTAQSHQRHTAALATTDASVPGDRWMEIDLYWFDQGHLQKSVDEFWDRFAPMYAGVQGDRGVILNVGWTVGYIMEWSGDLQQRITLPKGTGQQPWVSETSSLAGTTEERKQAWKERFAKPILVPKLGYGPWTYGDLKQLGEMLRATGKRRGIDHFKVGSLVYAWDNAYGEVAPWATRHPEAFTRMQKGAEHVYVGARRYFDPALTLHRDDARMGGLPHGITEGMPAHEAFAAQWGSLSRATGLDAIMLRDSIGFLIPYVRRGPVGDVMPDPQSIKRVTDSVEALVKETKQANPRALVMMYSNAASAISDWRSNGCDLEKIAKEGYLDVFVDQTWAGAWNEVGVRHNNFWNTPTLGWTYQLDYTLLHGAMLADTKVKHYPLIETFDAWESWDVLHTVPQRLRWGIWAYSHAGVKTPHGLRMPEGSYISWANQGKRLLTEEDVRFLSENIGAAVRDAHQTADIYGPTLVYARSTMQWEAEHATPTSSIKEWIDELGASVGKWPVPILSATRVEWLPKIQTDLAIVQTPVHLTPSEMAGVKARVASGKPTAIFGSFAGGVDASLLKLIGVEGAKATEDAASVHTATLGDVSGLHAMHLPQSFPTLTRLNQTSWNDNAKARAVYSIDSSPQLLMNAKQTLVMWDPADATIGKRGVPLRETWGGSAAPYVVTAAALNALLARGHALHAEAIDMDQTGAVGAWRTRDGRLHMLFGNVEEGLRDDADGGRHFTMQLPAAWHVDWKPVWKADPTAWHPGRKPTDNPVWKLNPAAIVSNGLMKVGLSPDSSLLMEGR